MQPTLDPGCFQPLPGEAALWVLKVECRVLSEIQMGLRDGSVAQSPCSGTGHRFSPQHHMVVNDHLHFLFPGT